MAGNIGSPLCAELNRIANNGVYPDRDDFLEEQGAANVWAGTTGQGLLGALNYIVDPTRTENNFSDLTQVCNELAGTTGLSDVDALRTINHAAEVLLRGTTPQSAVFSTDAATPRYNYPGYVYLPGITGQYISTPDAASLDVTGDIDVRVQVAMDSWTSTVETKTLLSKDNISAGTRSYSLDINTVGSGSGLIFTWTTDGSTSTRSVKTSTTAIPFTAGQTGWVRAALDVNNGASGNTVTFFTSTDGTTWTTLGTPVVTAGTTSVYAGTSEVQIGAVANQQLPAGKFYRAQIFASIDGTDKRLDADLTTNVTSATYDQFTATTGQLCTINGQNTLTNAGKAGALLPTTVGSSLAADSNDAKFLAHTGTNYVNLPGVDANLLTTPATSAFDITGDIDIRGRVAMDDWTPANISVILAKNQFNAEVNSYSLAINTDGTLRLNWYDSVGTSFLNNSIATGLADGSVKWVRATLDVDNGASGFDVKFFLSDDGITWTQLGTTQTTAGVTNIRVSTQLIGIGNRPNQATFPLAGKIYRVQLFNGIDGTKVLDVDTSVIATGAATSFTAVTGQTVTINRGTSGRKTVAVTQPTWLFGTDDYMEVNNRYMAHSTSDENYVYLSGVTNNNMTVADSPPLDITGDLDIQVKVALDDWTPTGTQRLVSKYSTSDNQRSYSLYVTSTGYLELAWSNNGTTAITKTSTVTPTVTDGGTLWVRATLDIDNGAAGNDVKFFTSTDGTTWTQLGSTVTTAGTTSVYSGSATLFIGDYSQVNQSAKGKFFRAIIKNGIDGTTVLDANAAVITLPSQTTFTDSSSNAYTVTINKSGVGTFVSTGNYLYLPGVSGNNASTPDAAALDIVGDIDIRVKVALDDWTPGAFLAFVSKYTTTGDKSFAFQISNTNVLNLTWSANNSTLLEANSTVAPTITDGAVKWVRATLDVDNGASGRDIKFFTSDDGTNWTQLGSTVTQAGTTSIFSGTSPVQIGTHSSVSSIARGKFFRAQVLNGIGGTVVFDANFENSITSLTQASFTESSSNAATVTINRSGSTFRSAGVIDAGYLYPGATNTFSNSTIDYLNFGATDSFTLFGAVRFWNTGNSGTIVTKGFSTDKRYLLRQATTNSLGYLTDVRTPGNIVTGAETANGTNGQTSSVFGVINRNTQTSQTYLNSVSTATSNISAVGSMVSDLWEFRIGRQSSTGVNYADMELYAVAVFRSASLTTKNIADITNYFQGRD